MTIIYDFFNYRREYARIDREKEGVTKAEWEALLRKQEMIVRLRTSPVQTHNFAIIQSKIKMLIYYYPFTLYTVH